jgi:hypothetical protein
VSPLRVDRRPRGPDQLLGLKMFIFVAGAILAVAGMATDRPWMIYTAAAVLSIGVALRFFGRARRSAADDAPDTAASQEPFRDDVTRDDVTRDDVTRDDVHRDDAHRDDVHRDDVHRDDVHRDDAHRDDVHRDDVHRDDVRRDDVTRDDVHRDDVHRDDDARGT